MTKTQPVCDIILLAAGSSRRMGGIKKQFQKVAGKAVYEHAWQRLTSSPLVGQVVLVAPQDDVETLKEKHANDALLVTSGGKERHHSVQKGLQALGEKAPFIAIHDAARPMIPLSVIEQGMAALQEGHQAVIPALSVADTIKMVSDTEPHKVAKTLDRSQLRRIQTPQFFESSLIHKLHADHSQYEATITDDAMMAEAKGIDVHLIDGDSQLDKITWDSDLQTLRESFMTREYRTGTGFDVHRFTEGHGPIMICGLAVDHDKALDAHSDGDVGIHALCDAIFGALCDGDIGMHFPPTEPQWKDAASHQFLSYAIEKIAEAGGQLTHVDVTILCERPKIGPHRDAMRQILADICQLPITRVSVKATTTEKLGFTGRGDGIAAQAAATIAFPSSAI